MSIPTEKFAQLIPSGSKNDRKKIYAGLLSMGGH